MDHSDLGILHLGGSTSTLRWFIAGEDKSIDEFGVINGASDLLDDLDVSKVNCVCILVLRVNDLDL